MFATRFEKNVFVDFLSFCFLVESKTMNNQQRVAVLGTRFTSITLLKIYFTFQLFLAFIFGTLLGWSAPTTDPIIDGSDYGFKVSMEQFAWIVGLMALGGVFSCVFLSVVRSRIGTRLTIALFGIPIVVGWAMITLATSPIQVRL